MALKCGRPFEMPWRSIVNKVKFKEKNVTVPFKYSFPMLIMVPDGLCDFNRSRGQYNQIPEYDGGMGDKDESGKGKRWICLKRLKMAMKDKPKQGKKVFYVASVGKKNS